MCGVPKEKLGGFYARYIPLWLYYPKRLTTTSDLHTQPPCHAAYMKQWLSINIYQPCSMRTPNQSTRKGASQEGLPPPPNLVEFNRRISVPLSPVKLDPKHPLYLSDQFPFSISNSHISKSIYSDTINHNSVLAL